MEFPRIFNIFKKTSTKQETRILKEDLTLQNIIANVGGWKSKFINNIYNTDILTPHEEMLRAIKGYNYNSYIHAAVDTLRDFIIGGEIEVKSDDEYTEELMQEFFEKSGLKRVIPELVRDLIILGNAYIERIIRDGKTIGFKYNNNPQRIYIDYDFSKNIVKRYIQEVPEGLYIKNMGTYTLTYYLSKKKSIRGIEIPPEKILHLRIGRGLIPFYGRGAVCTIINDIEINNEIDRSIAILSRYKAIPKKIIVLKDAPPIVIDRFKDDLNTLNDYENPITNQEVEVKDLTTTADISQGIVDYIKRKLTVALAPEYLLHGEETNRATAKEQRIGFLLRVKAIREEIAYYIDTELTRIAKNNGLKGKVWIKFGEFDIGEEDEEINRTTSLWNNGLITLNEARKRLGLREDPEYGEFYKWELTNTPGQDEEGQVETPPDNQGAEKEKNINK